jgi:hypothetical protein
MREIGFEILYLELPAYISMPPAPEVQLPPEASDRIQIIVLFRNISCQHQHNDMQAMPFPAIERSRERESKIEQSSLGQG